MGGLEGATLRTHISARCWTLGGNVMADTPGLRIVGLNILHGGLRRATAIAAALERLDPDVVVMPEAWPSERGRPLWDRLAGIGLTHLETAESDTPDVPSSVAIASRTPMSDVTEPLAGSLNRQRVLEATVGDVVVVGVYFPLNREKVTFWREEFLPYAQARVAGSLALLGDWNSGRHFEDEAGRTLLGAKEFEAMSAMGWTDAWRSRNPDGREFTWYSPRPYRNGFRLDHAFLSPSVAPRLLDTHFVHETREERVSDHSALVVDLARS